MKSEKRIQKVVDLLINSKYALVLTGAGISTDSGIPDFRSPGSGLWEKVDPMEVFSSFAFQRNPRRFYEEGLKMLSHFSAAKPNISHLLLAKLEEKSLLNLIITQNIDGLHQKAGSQNVIELHGNLREGTCLGCGRKYSMETILEKIKDEIPPLCHMCGGIIKPDLILFGDMLPEREYNLAQEACLRCDLMLVMGSSLIVAPVDRLPATAVSGGAKLIILNAERTIYDRQAEVVINGSLSQISESIDIL